MVAVSACRVRVPESVATVTSCLGLLVEWSRVLALRVLVVTCGGAEVWRWSVGAGIWASMSSLTMSPCAHGAVTCSKHGARLESPPLLLPRCARNPQTHEAYTSYKVVCHVDTNVERTIGRVAGVRV